MQDGSKEARLYDELEQAMTEVAISRQKASEEAVRFAKAERDAVETIRRVYSITNLSFFLPLLSISPKLSPSLFHLVSLVSKRTGCLKKMEYEVDINQFIKAEDMDRGRSIDDISYAEYIIHIAN